MRRILLTVLLGLSILAMDTGSAEASRALPLNQHVVRVNATWSPPSGPAHAVGRGCDALELANSLRDDMIARGFGNTITASGNTQNSQVFYLHFGFPPYPSRLGVTSRLASACGSVSLSASVTELPGIGWVIDIAVN